MRGAPLTVMEQAIGLLRAARADGPASDVLLPPMQVSQAGEVLAASWLRSAGLRKAAGRRWCGAKYGPNAVAAVAAVVEQRETERATSMTGKSKSSGQGTVDSGQRKTDGRLDWHEEINNSTTMHVAASEANASTEGQLHWRVSQKGKGWHIHLSDSELASDLPKHMMGPYPTAAAAKAFCQQRDDKAFERNLAEVEDSLTAGGSKAADAGKVTRFDPDNPWPAGTVITLSTGAVVRISEVRTDEVGGVIELVWIKGRLPEDRDCYSFAGWDSLLAHYVDVVEFPQDAKAEGGRQKAEDMARPSDAVTAENPFYARGPHSIAVGKLDPPAAEPLPTVNCPLSTALASEPARLPIPRPSDVSVDLIDVVHNVRSEQSLFDDSLASLGESIETQGQIETVKLMRLPGGRFRLLDGERRYRSVKASGLASLRAEVFDTTLSDAQILRLQLTTFATRKDLTHREWADGLADYAARGGLTGSQVAKALGLGDDFVRKHLAYRETAAGVQQLVDEGRVSLNKALTIGRLPGDQQEDLAKRAWLHGLSEQQVAEEVNRILLPPSAGLLAACSVPVRAYPESGIAPDGATTNAEPAKPTPPADSAWKGRHVKAMGMSARVADSLTAAGLWCAGLVAQFQATHGLNWTREITGLGEAAAAEVDAAMERLWLPAAVAGGEEEDGEDGDGPTDEHDQPNHKRIDRINQAPIKGTKAQTAAERDAQAKADSDAASRVERSAVVGARFVGTSKGATVSVDSARGWIEATNAEIAVTIGGVPFAVSGFLTLKFDVMTARRLLKAANAAAKKATGKKPVPVKPAAKKRKR